MMKMTESVLSEKWESVVGFEGHYEVSNFGSVRNSKTKHVLTQAVSTNKYLVVHLWKANKGKTCTVHRLVASAFILNPEQKGFVNHLDSNRLNNSVNNLEWCTKNENAKHGYDYGKVRPPRLDKEVYQLGMDGKIIAKYPSIRIAAEATGSDRSHITKVLKGKLPHANKFKWELCKK